ncbi:MAG: prepilin-type N-terminal cleavage/methylation domain-containing protein [Planctomycetota bacterium]|nr:prepilin-type N-terminal cleavage/methylation domain-containing protein [Planctomycetota bacterium]
MHFNFIPISGGGRGHNEPGSESTSRTASRAAPYATGFTLIELMIVVSIIAVLATLVTKMIQVAQAKAAEAQATTTIATLKNAIESFNRDEGVYPGWSLEVDDPEEFNGFPALYEGIAGERPPNGKGGKNSPYTEFDNSMIVVVDEDFEDEFKEAGRSIFDSDVDKFYLDPWQEPYIYRENRSKRSKEEWMIRRSGFDLWSAGPDSVNDAWYGVSEEGEEYDDIGNW